MNSNINSSAKVAQFMRQIIPPADQDTLPGIVWLIGIDTKGEICVIERTQCTPEGFNMFAATLIPAQWEPYRIACCRSARYMFLVHTHKAGNPKPSKEDLRFTERQMKEGKAFAVQVIDHIILSGDEHYSMADYGVLGMSEKLFNLI